MIDEIKAQKARMDGVCFLCSMCERWHEGMDQGLKDAFGEGRCAQSDDCKGPVWGGTFHEYKGPMSGHKLKWCYLCGEESSHALAPKASTGDPVGVCTKCLEEVKKLTARDLGPNQHSLVIAELKADPDRYEVTS